MVFAEFQIVDFLKQARKSTHVKTPRYSPAEYQCHTFPRWSSPRGQPPAWCFQTGPGGITKLVSQI